MLKRLAQIFVLFIAFCIAVFAFWFIDLWNDTNSAFEEIEKSIIMERPFLPAEITIKQVLFLPANNKIMNPEDILALDALVKSRPDNLIISVIERRVLAHRLRRKFTSNSLYLTWLSQQYFGHGKFGVSAISETLFNTQVSELTEKEAIAIAVLSRRPNLCHTNPDKWHEMQKSSEERLRYVEQGN